MSALEAHKLLDTRMSTSEVEDGAGVFLGALPHEYREESSCTQTTSRQPLLPPLIPFPSPDMRTGTPLGHPTGWTALLRCDIACVLLMWSISHEHQNSNGDDEAELSFFLAVLDV